MKLQNWHKKRSAEYALRRSAELLRNYDLKEILKLSGRLSLHEALTSEADPLSASSMLSVECVRIFSGLTITCGANFKRSKRLPSENEFAGIINSCKHAMQDPKELRLLKLANRTEGAHLALQRMVARMSLIQISAQEPMIRLRTTRLIAMLEVLPSRCAGDLAVSDKTRIMNTLARMESALGASLRDLLIAYIDVLNWLKVAASQSRIATEGRAPPLSARARETKIIHTFLSPEELLDEYFIFSLDRLSKQFYTSRNLAEEARHRLESFIRLAARPAGELSRLAREVAIFRAGHVGKRLSPLERHPMVRIDPPASGQETKFIVPNYRHFVPIFPKLVDFTLFEMLGSDYAHARGALLHLYLQKLVETRLPEITLIPETVYSSAQGDKRSADLTLIEASTGRIIGIEIKGRALSLQARVSMEGELLEQLKDLYVAVRKLPDKIADLRARKPEFRQWSSLIESTRRSVPILIGVLREGLPTGMSRLVREEARQDVGHPLHLLELPYCVFSAETFERAVEKAARTGRPLSELFLEHYKVSGEYDYTRDDSDMFGEREILEESVFAVQLLKEARS
jgi:hypothetical protein